jgi:hypothetical protein
LRERGFVKDSSHRVADLLHDHSSPAESVIGALVTLAVGGFAGAGQRRQRTFDQADDVADGDFGRRFGQHVPAALAFLAGDESLAFEIEEDIFEELLRDCFFRRDFCNECRPLAVVSGQRVERPQAILGLLGKCPLPASLIFS